ncbi:N-acetylneuraminate synthase [archaeon]|nr:N-acetylneuraminate synthase [archaeon]
MSATINGVEINQKKNGTYIVLEAGPTHYGLESAKALVTMAKEAGANAVKFQYLYADRLVADKSVMFSYKALERDASGHERLIEVEEPLHTILARRELQTHEWKELKKYCDEIDITMFSTATFPDEVDFLVDELGIDSIKIASSDVAELDFIRYCASKGVNIQLDTGSADLWEIERAVIAAEEEGCDNIIIHLCPSGYPAHLESIHLNMLKTLKTLFPDCGIAFSDHSLGWDMDIAAVALGADMVEKTITLDRTTRSCEHSFSLEKKQALKFVNSIRDVEIALGDHRRVFPKDVRSKRMKTRRSAYAKVDLPVGIALSRAHFEFRRPGYGITSQEFIFVEGRVLKKELKKDSVLTKEHC